MARVHPGLPVRITMDAFRGQSFPGTLSYVSSFVETRQEQNRTLTVEAVFTEAGLPANVLPGLSADVEVILDPARRVAHSHLRAARGRPCVAGRGRRLESTPGVDRVAELGASPR